MASQITATLPTLDFPKEVDYPTQEDWAAFSAAAELNFGILGNGWSTQMQLWKTEANAMSIELNNSADIAQSTVNYKGDWISQGYTLGQTVSVGEVYYICKLTHATGQNPTTGGSLYWNLALGNWSLKADKTEVALKIDKDISPYSSKPTPVDTDLLPLSDSASSFGIKKLTWANIKATLKTYFDTLYSSVTWVANDSRVKTALNAIGTAPIYACRAWVNFNGTGTVSIRASGNVSSIADNGVGNYAINYAINMPDENYVFAPGINTDIAVPSGSVSIKQIDGVSSSISSLTIRTFAYTGSTNGTVYSDLATINICILR